MPYPLNVKSTAISLRKQGFSLKEISEELNIAKSTASVWLSDIILSSSAQQKLAQKRILGQYKTVLIRKRIREEQKKILEGKAKLILQPISINRDLAKLCCSLVWWCEGAKNTTSVRFTNSDPTLIKNFLFFIKKSL